MANRTAISLSDLGQNAASRMGEIITRGADRQGQILREIADARARGDIQKAQLLSQAITQVGDIPKQVVGFQDLMRKRKMEEETHSAQMGASRAQMAESQFGLDAAKHKVVFQRLAAVNSPEEYQRELDALQSDGLSTPQETASAKQIPWTPAVKDHFTELVTGPVKPAVPRFRQGPMGVVNDATGQITTPAPAPKPDKPEKKPGQWVKDAKGFPIYVEAPEGGGMPTLPQGFTPAPEKQPNESFEEQTYQDGIKNGLWKDRTGMLRWKSNLQSNLSTGLTPEALNMMGQLFRNTGDIPNFGFGKAGAEAKVGIINKVAQQGATGGELSENKAGFKADSASLTQAQKSLDAVTAFENTASKNLDMFLEKAKGVIDAGSPWANKPIRIISQQGLGSADLAAFNAARQVALTEIAKVTNNPNLTGQLSDSARHEIEAIMGPNATLAQIYSTAATLKRDMANRRTALTQQVQEIHSRTGRRDAAPQSGSAPDGTTHEVIVNGKVVGHTSDGKTMIPVGQ